jgi:hypothetical protein
MRNGAKWGFGSEVRKGPIESARKNSPGPGGYNLESMAFSTKPRFFVGEKLKTAKDVTKKTLPSYSMKAKLGSSLVDEKNTVPGAGTYELNMNTKKAAPKFGFGSSTRNPLKPNTTVPGPGAYRVPSTIGDVPAYAMPNRKDEDKYI